MTDLSSKIDLVHGDITTLDVDAIVNAANNSLLGGGGVDGAIHRAAGKELLDECQGLNGCATGDARITKGYKLKAKYVIHAVGPVWYGGHKDEFELLASCYRKSLELAREHRIGSLAFPGISTGVYRFPKDIAARIAIGEIKRFMARNSYPRKVLLVAFDSDSYGIYRNLLNTGL